jgi:hypothetical protein
MMPLWQAVLLLRQAGYSEVRYFPNQHRPMWLMVAGLGQIWVTDGKVPVRSLPPLPTPVGRRPQRPLPSTRFDVKPLGSAWRSTRSNPAVS